MDEMDDGLEEINETLIYPAPVSFRVNLLFFFFAKNLNFVEIQLFDSNQNAT
jgi:hypothetical protein